MNSFMLLSSAAFGLPVVQAKSTATQAENVGSSVASQKVKVSSIPLYPEPEKYEYSSKPPSQLEDLVKDVRIQATGIKAEYQPVLDKILHIVNTGRAHTNDALMHLRDEDNIIGQFGAIAFGGVLGLASARRRGIFRKLASFIVGLGGAGAVCYPEQAKILAGEAGHLALKKTKVVYHFIVGARPSIPNENGKPFEKVVGMASDMGKWGYNMLGKEKPLDPEPEILQSGSVKDVVVTEETVPQEVAINFRDPADATVPVHENSSNNIEESVDSPYIPSLESSEEVKDEPLDATVTGILTETALDDLTKSAETLQASADVSLTSLPNTIIEEKPVTDNGTNNTKEEREKVVVKETGSQPTTFYQVDLGQGNPEDKELYTTRE